MTRLTTLIACPPVMQLQLLQQASQERRERRQHGRRRSAGAATYRSTRGLRALPASNLPGSLCGSSSAFLRTQHRIARRFQEGVDETREFRSEEHTSELQSLMRISYAVFCWKKNKKKNKNN